MRKLTLILISSIILTINVFGQKNVEVINGFKYALVNILTYDNNGIDIYGVSNYISNELSKKGLIVLGNNRNNWPIEAKSNTCLIGYWYPNHSGGGIANSAKGGYVIKNCKNEIVYENFSTASHFGYYYEQNVPLSIEKAFKPISSLKYNFNQSLTTKIEYPTVETTSETEESIKKYLDKLMEKLGESLNCFQF